MAAFSVTPVFPRAFHSFSHNEQCKFLQQCTDLKLAVQYSLVKFSERKLRRIVAFAVSGNAEESFKKTLEIDKRIDLLRDTNDKEKDYEELAASVMSVVDHIVHKTKEKIESATDVLKEILKAVVDGAEEICWPPRDPEAINIMKKT